jgi:hypothetical protein
VYVKDVKLQSSECYPEGFQSLWSLGLPFSPGGCPESYAAVSSQSEQDVTTVLCCPGYVESTPERCRRSMVWPTFSRSITAHGGELGCYSEVASQTVLALPTGPVTV